MHSRELILPRTRTAVLTAGLKCPPETCPPAKTITISTAPIASGASTPAPAWLVAMPTVNMKMNIPMNSTMNLRSSG